MKAQNLTATVKSPDQFQADLERRNPAVSVSSKFKDLVWDFSEEITNPTYAKSDKAIKWDFEIKKKVRFSDPKYASLMLACKQLLYAMLWHPQRLTKYRFSPKSVTEVWFRLRHFIRFLVGRKYPILRFKDVTRHVVEEYLKFLEQPKKKGRARGKHGRYHYYNMLRWLYLYRLKISDPLQFDPFDGELPSAVLGITRVSSQADTEYIPDAVLSKLLTSALEYVYSYSSVLIEAAAIVERIRREHNGLHKSTVRHHLIRRLPDAISHLDVNDNRSFGLGVLNARTIAEHVIRLRTACFIVIAFVTGMRLSEILALEVGCVEVEKTEDGEFIWLRSTLYKTVGDGRGVSTRWLCGPAAARAVTVLEQLTAEYRRRIGSPRLFLPVTRWGAHALSGKGLAAKAMAEKLLSYVQWLDLRDEKGNLFHLHPHMFRRTFARYVVRTDTTNLLALKAHFKHVSLAMTDYYVGVDEELQDLLNDEANRLSFESFDRALRSDRLGGPRGKELVRQVDAAISDGRLPAEFRGEAGAHLRREMVADWITAGQQIYPGGAGNDCWFRAGLALCTQGDQPVVEICNAPACPNSVITPEHDSHWQSIEERAEGLLGLNPVGEPYRQHLYKIIRVAKNVRSDIA